MAKELRHADAVAGKLTENEYEATNEHIADGGATDEILVVQADETIKASPVNTAIASHIADLDAHILSFEQGFLVGKGLPLPSFGASSNIALPQYQLFATYMVVPRDMTFSHISIRIQTLDGAGKDIRLGLYNCADFYPTTLIEDFGTVDCDSAAVKTIDITDRSLTKGRYFLVGITDSAGVAKVYSLVCRGGGMGLSDTGVYWVGGGYTKAADAATFATLPANFPAGGSFYDISLIIALRIASLD